MSTHDVTESVEIVIVEGTKPTDGIVKNVKILGAVSKNGRKYPRNVMEAAAGKYENAPVNINHPKSTDSGSRSFESRFGVVRSVKVVGEDLRGDLHYNPKHVLAGQFEWAVENQPKTIGLSHVARIKERNDRGGLVVEEIQAVRSVDLVAEPATTDGIFESVTKGESVMDLSGVTVESLKSARPDIVAAFVSEANEKASKTAELESLRAQVKEANEKLEKFAAEAATAKRRGEVVEAFRKLGVDANDEKLVRASLWKVLMAMESADEIAEAVQDHAETLEAAGKIGGASGDSRSIADRIDAGKATSKFYGAERTAKPVFESAEQFARAARNSGRLGRFGTV